MRILVTGNLGYIGSVLTEILNPEYEVIGYDIGFFKDSVLTKTVGPEKQIYKDIRDVNEKDVEGVKTFDLNNIHRQLRFAPKIK